MDDEMRNARDEVTDNCKFCHKRGGKVRLDPYAYEIMGERVKVRLHDDCHLELAAEV